MSLLLINILLALVVGIVLVGFLTRRADDPREIGEWARAYGLVLGPRNRLMVTYYVRLAIITRVVGGVAAIPIGSLFDQAFGLGTSAAAGFWAWVIGGWTFGAWWAERELRWSAGSGAASLLPRRSADYLPGRLRAAPVAAFGVIVVLLATAPLLTATDARPSVRWLAAVLAASAAVTLTTLLAVRRVVARRQPPLDPDLLAADDAIRTSAAHQLAGGGTAVVLMIGSTLAVRLGTGPSGYSMDGTYYVVACALFVAGWIAWRYYTYRTWRVRRVPRPAPAPRAVAS